MRISGKCYFRVGFRDRGVRSEVDSENNTCGILGDFCGVEGMVGGEGWERTARKVVPEGRVEDGGFVVEGFVSLRGVGG